MVKGIPLREERVHVDKDKGGSKPVDGRLGGAGTEGHRASLSRLLDRVRSSLVILCGPRRHALRRSVSYPGLPVL